MKLLNLVQGSDEWLEARLNYLCASEAPAMMGESKFMSRNQLLDLKKGWLSNPDSKFKKRLYEKGHEHEDAARNILEISMLEEWPPVVGLLVIDGIELLASFDGLRDGITGSCSWEHKSYNATLAENIRNKVIEPMYYWQLEHQMLVNGSTECLFACSDGTEENNVVMTYSSMPERREQLIAGWKQFVIDLEAHEIEAKVEVVEAEKTTLPAVVAQVTGTDINTNIGDCLASVNELALEEMNRVLETDQDFANKDQLNKDVKKAREALKKSLASVESEFVSYSEFAAIAKELDGVLQKMQSDGERKVKQAKEAKKQAIVDTVNANLIGHIKACDMQISPLSIASIMGNVSPDWVSAMKNKRTIESLQASVDEVLATWKVAINQVMDVVEPNQKYLRENASDFPFLFNDVAQIINQPCEAFQAMVKIRIHEYKEAEEQRQEQERQRAEAAEKAKAERQVAETPKTPEAPTVADNNTLAPEQMATPDVSADILKAAQVLAHEFCDMITASQAADIVEFIACGQVPGVNTDF